MPGQEKKLPGKSFLLLRIPVRVRAGFFLSKTLHVILNGSCGELVSVPPFGKLMNLGRLWRGGVVVPGG